MALSDTELQDIIDRLSPEDRKLLLSQLGRQVEVDKITNPTDATGEQTRPKTEPKVFGSKVYCCPACGSGTYKCHGTTRTGMQRYICKDCGKTFSENYGDSLRYSHLSDNQWHTIITGLVYHHSLTLIADDAGISVSTAWSCMAKVNQAIATMYGYSDLFQGNTQADEYYTRACFKGKRSPEFFIYTLRRMPRHHRNRDQKIEYLQKAGLYNKLQSEEPDYLEELLDDEPKMKRGISNEQICILTLIDENNQLYLEPVTVGRLEKAMVKAKFKGKFKDKKSVFVTDDHKAYNRVLYGSGVPHKVVPADKHSVGKFNLAKVNSIHSALASYMDIKTGRVYTTKYLDLNLMLFWWLFKYKNFSTEEKVQALYDIMNDKIPDIEIKERVNQVTLRELQGREITLNTKGCFPTKL